MKLVIVLIIVLFLCLSTIKLDEHFENEVKPKICSRQDDLEFVCIQFLHKAVTTKKYYYSCIFPF